MPEELITYKEVYFMRIDSSAVGMQSDRSYSACSQRNSVSVSTSANSAAAVISFSQDTQVRLEQMEEEEKNSQKQQEEQQKKNLEAQAARMRESGQAAGVTETKQTGPAGSVSEIKLQILRTLIETMKRLQMLNARKGKPVDLSQIKRLEKQYESARKQMGQPGAGIGMTAGIGAGISRSSASRQTVWQRTTVTSGFMSETENTAYSANGIVRTSDGREIGFHVNVEMSRAFCETYSEITQDEYIVTDPLMINLDTDTANVTDQKFLFDIDSDGHKEEISFAGKGSGFLALDKNKDGVINDGSELFGTKSGDGFKDLSAYDQDGNGWIDEADSVFEDLRIWTKDENGHDRLLTLKEAGVGALYLGSSSTKFSLNDAQTNETQAVIRKTGIYLKENGEAGTLQHVDLVL